jgi:hypothetical protein
MTDQRPPSPSKALFDRRRLLAASVGAIGLGGAGAAWVATRDPKDLVIALVRNALPGVRIEEASVQSFATDYIRGFHRTFSPQRWSERLLADVKLHTAEAVRGVVGVGVFAPRGVFGGFAAQKTRRALTRFLMNSNFFVLDDPSAELVVYSPPATEICRNPFADVRPPRAEDITPWL